MEAFILLLFAAIVCGGFGWVMALSKERAEPLSDAPTPDQVEKLLSEHPECSNLEPEFVCLRTEDLLRRLRLCAKSLKFQRLDSNGAIDRWDEERRCQERIEELEASLKEIEKPKKQWCEKRKKPFIGKPALATLVLLLLLSIGLNIYQHTNYLQTKESYRQTVTELEGSVAQLELSIEEKDTKIAELRENALTMKEQIAKYRDAAEFLYEHIAIVLADGTGLFHNYQCPELEFSSFWAYNVEAAVSNGYDQCPYCSNFFDLDSELNDDYYSQIVYVTNLGERYHRKGCSYLKSSNEITLRAAINKGYRPCSRCDPPT